MGTGRSPSQSPPVVTGMASGRPEAVADDEREGEVGPAVVARELVARDVEALACEAAWVLEEANGAD